MERTRSSQAWVGLRTSGLRCCYDSVSCDLTLQRKPVLLQLSCACKSPPATQGCSFRIELVTRSQMMSSITHHLSNKSRNQNLILTNPSKLTRTPTLNPTLLPPSPPMSAGLAAAPPVLIAAVKEPKLPWDEVTFSKTVFVVSGEGGGGGGVCLFEQLRTGKCVLPKTE